MKTKTKPDLSAADGLLGLAAILRARYPGLIRDLRIEPVEGGVALYGQTTSYHAFQVILNEVTRRAGLTVVGLHMVVNRAPVNAEAS